MHGWALGPLLPVAPFQASAPYRLAGLYGAVRDLEPEQRQKLLLTDLRRTEHYHGNEP
jgi:hypothetical protein